MARDEAADGVLSPGTRVEVRSPLDGQWSSGFVVTGAEDGGYRLRRRGEREPLDGIVATDAVRRESSRSMWWV